MTFIYPHDAVAKFTPLFDIYYMLTSNNPFPIPGHTVIPGKVFIARVHVRGHDASMYGTPQECA